MGTTRRYYNNAGNALLNRTVPHMNLRWLTRLHHEKKSTPQKQVARNTSPGCRGDYTMKIKREEIIDESRLIKMGSLSGR